MKKIGIKQGKATSAIMKHLMQTVVMSKARYAIHVRPQTEEIRKTWEALEKANVLNTLGWSSERKEKRFRVVLRWPTLEQTKGKLLKQLERRVEKRGIGRRTAR